MTGPTAKICHTRTSFGDRQIGFFRNKRPYLVPMLGQGIALMAAEFSWLAVACCINSLH
jgi:hypothetical protein